MIIGHKKQLDLLAKISRKQEIPHAFLFAGPTKIGKRKIALEFVKMIFCEKDFCDVKKIEENLFPDLKIIYPENKELKIEQIRDLTESLSLKSYNNYYKVGIIDDAHLMRKEAQNALLKTLEEPKGRTVLILITPFKNQLLSTIRSRVEIINFSLVPKRDIEKHLIDLGASKEKVQEIVAISSGQIGKAIEFFNNEEKIKLFNKSINDIISLCRSGFFERFSYAKELAEEDDLEEVLDIWQRFFRREMMFKIFNSKSNLKDHSIKRLKYIIEDIEKTKYLVESTNTNKKLALENLILNF